MSYCIITPILYYYIVLYLYTFQVHTYLFFLVCDMIINAFIGFGNYQFESLGSFEGSSMLCISLCIANKGVIIPGRLLCVCIEIHQ